MRIRVFSIIAERVGAREIEVDIVLPATGSDLLTALAARVPAVEDLKSAIRIAVNHEYVDLRREIREGDEVALITPTSGG